MAQKLPHYRLKFRERFHQELSSRLNLEELRRLCDLHFGINYEDLPDGTLSDKCLALVNYTERHERWTDLIEACKKINPAGNWEAGGLILVNLSGRPFTAEQSEQVESLRGKRLLRVIDASKKLEEKEAFEPQLRAVIQEHALLTQFRMSDPETLLWLPPLAPAAAILLAIAHAHKGSLPSILRVQHAGGERWEVAEIIDLGEIRRTELAFLDSKPG